MTTVATTSVERRLREHQAELQARVAGLTRAPERGSGISFGKRVGDGTTEAVSESAACVGCAGLPAARLSRCC